MHPVALGLGYLLNALEALLKGPPGPSEHLAPLGQLNHLFLIEWGLTVNDLKRMLQIWDEILPFLNEPWILEYKSQFLEFVRGDQGRAILWLSQLSTLIALQGFLLDAFNHPPQLLHLLGVGSFLEMAPEEVDTLYQQGALRAAKLIEFAISIQPWLRQKG